MIEVKKVRVPAEIFLAGGDIGEYLYKRGLDISLKHSAMVSRFSEDMIYEQEEGLFPRYIQVYGYTFKEVEV